jgi:hypothetical protein
MYMYMYMYVYIYIMHMYPHIKWILAYFKTSLGYDPAPAPGYHYNPARPTPAAGGPSFNPLNTGAKDQAKIEVGMRLHQP